MAESQIAMGVGGEGNAVFGKETDPRKAGSTLCDDIMRRQSQQDSNFNIAFYGDTPRKQMGPSKDPSGRTGIDTSTLFAESKSDGMRTASVLAGLYVKQLHELSKMEQDANYGSSQENMGLAKQRAKVRDLSIILRQLAMDSDLGTNDVGQQGRNPVPKKLEHAIRQVTNDQDVIGYIFKEVISKNAPLKRKANVMALVTDDNNPLPAFSEAARGHTGQLPGKGSRKGVQSEEQEYGDNKRTFNYKEAAKGRKDGDNRTKLSAFVPFADGDLTQTKKLAATLAMAHFGRDSDSQTTFGTNDSGERLIAPLGKKYLTPFIDRDGALNEVSDSQN
jgi:hypothetical protein